MVDGKSAPLLAQGTTHIDQDAYIEYHPQHPLLLPLATPGPPIAKLTSVFKDVLICTPDAKLNEVCFKAQRGDPLFAHSIVKTGERGRARITYPDPISGTSNVYFTRDEDAYGIRYKRVEGAKQSTINVGSSTTLGVRQTLQQADRLQGVLIDEWWEKFFDAPVFSLTRDSKISMLSDDAVYRAIGDAFTKNWAFRSQFNVRTGTSLCGIRGTDAIAKRDPKKGTTTLAVLDGEIACGNKDTPQTAVKRGKKLVLHDGGSQAELSDLSDAERRALTSDTEVPETGDTQGAGETAERKPSGKEALDAALNKLDSLIGDLERHRTSMSTFCQRLARAVTPSGELEKTVRNITEAENIITSRLESVSGSHGAAIKSAKSALSSAADQIRTAQQPIKADADRFCNTSNASERDGAAMAADLVSLGDLQRLMNSSLEDTRRRVGGTISGVLNGAEPPKVSDLKSALDSAARPLFDKCAALGQAGQNVMRVPGGLWGLGAARLPQKIGATAHDTGRTLLEVSTLLAKKSGELSDSAHALYQFRLTAYRARYEKLANGSLSLASCPRTFDQMRAFCVERGAGEIHRALPAYQQLLQEFKERRDAGVADLRASLKELEASQQSVAREVDRATACAKPIADTDKKDADIAEGDRKKAEKKPSTDCGPEKEGAGGTGLDKGFIPQGTYSDNKASCQPSHKEGEEKKLAEKKQTDDATPKGTTSGCQVGSNQADCGPPPTASRNRPAAEELAEVNKCDQLAAQFNIASNNYKNNGVPGIKNAQKLLNGLKNNQDLTNCKKLAGRVDRGLGTIKRMGDAWRRAKQTLASCDPGKFSAHIAQLRKHADRQKQRGKKQHTVLAGVRKLMEKSMLVAVRYRKAQTLMRDGDAGGIAEAESILRQTRGRAQRDFKRSSIRKMVCNDIDWRIDQDLAGIRKMRAVAGQLTAASGSCSEAGLEAARRAIKFGQSFSDSRGYYNRLNTRLSNATKSCAETRRRRAATAHNNRCKRNHGRSRASEPDANGRSGCVCESGFDWIGDNESLRCASVKSRKYVVSAIAKCKRRHGQQYAKTEIGNNGATCYSCPKGTKAAKADNGKLGCFDRTQKRRKVKRKRKRRKAETKRKRRKRIRRQRRPNPCANPLNCTPAMDIF
ncbi:MAG: hypothetical protein GY948_10620 [Alphaproteobacteria bacterium]|nr:hypothetical protein [Alphaproteobacteria bacterium]